MITRASIKKHLMMHLVFGLVAVGIGGFWSTETEARSCKVRKIAQPEIIVSDVGSRMIGDPLLVSEYQDFKASKPKNFKRSLISWLGYYVVDNRNYPSFCHMIETSARELELPTPTILVFRGNWYTQMNAFFTGADFKCNAFATSLSHDIACVCIGSDLLKYLSYEEVRAVMTHELAHVKHNHVRKRIFNSILLNIGCTAALNMLPAQPVVFGLGIVFNPWYVLCNNVFDAVRMGDSRRCEKEADLTALTVTQDPEPLISALEKIHTIYRKKHPFWAGVGYVINKIFFYKRSHPSNKKRAEYLRQAAANKQSGQVENKNRKYNKRKRRVQQSHDQMSVAIA